MRRRKFVKATSGFAVGGLAGCVGSEDDESEDDTEDTPETISDEQDATDSEDTSSQDLSGPAETLEAYHRADKGGFARFVTLSHSLTRDPYELISIETETLERDLQVERVAEKTGFTQDTLSSALDGEDTALVASTVRVKDAGQSNTIQEEWFLATEDGDWRVLSDASDEHSEEIQPNASFDFDYDTNYEQNTLTISLTSGDHILATNLYLRGELDGESVDANFTREGVFSQLAGKYSVSGDNGFDADESKRVKSGQGIEITAEDNPLDSYEIHLVWDTGDDSATLAESKSD